MYALDVTHHNAILADKLAQIYNLQENARLEMGFRQAFLDLLTALGNPHTKLPPVIHIAGTNGKGSTLAFTRAILNAAGYSCHAYTSPHLHVFNERILLRDQQISDRYLGQLLNRVWEVNEEQAVSFFEFTTALAFTAFAETQADVLLLETGLGGRLDCTNIVPHTCVCGITSIGFDHTAILGDTVVEIAAEKAGIIKAGADVVVGPQNPDRADDVDYAVQAASVRAGANIYSHGDSWWHWEADNAGLILHDAGTDVMLPPPALAGRHQYENAVTAAMICRRLAAQQFDGINPAALHKGLANAAQDGRLQKLTTQQCRQLDLAPHHTVYIDSAHNGDAARALAAEIKSWQRKGENVGLVIGMLAGKDAYSYLAPLAATGAAAIFVPIPGEEANMHDPAYLADIWMHHNGAQFQIEDRPGNAVRQVSKTADTVVITGSGYLLRNFA